MAAIKALKAWPEAGRDALSVAYSELDDAYVGHVLMEIEGGRECAVFPTVGEAEKAAGFAINLTLCGYYSVVLRPGLGRAVTHQSAEEWLYG